ncbi:MAG: recombinase family protein [Chloroflexi bacterium]|nr:recombinase family protein [Chloroflexota bacterium]
MRVAIYCRVSTDAQEQDGTSLQTQLEACLAYCKKKGYEIAVKYAEAYSAFSLERPKLGELREAVRSAELKPALVIREG